MAGHAALRWVTVHRGICGSAAIVWRTNICGQPETKYPPIIMLSRGVYSVPPDPYMSEALALDCYTGLICWIEGRRDWDMALELPLFVTDWS